MTLQAAIEAELPFLRAEAEARMTSRVIVRRKTGRMIQNETTGLEEPEWTIVHTGPMRLAGSERGSSGTRTKSEPGGEIQLATRAPHFPHDTTGLAGGDLIEITAGENAGTIWRTVESDGADQQTALRLPVVGEPRPEEWA